MCGDVSSSRLSQEKVLLSLVGEVKVSDFSTVYSLFFPLKPNKQSVGRHFMTMQINIPAPHQNIPPLPQIRHPNSAWTSPGRCDGCQMMSVQPQHRLHIPRVALRDVGTHACSCVPVTYSFLCDQHGLRDSHFLSSGLQFITVCNYLGCSTERDLANGSPFKLAPMC